MRFNHFVAVAFSPIILSILSVLPTSPAPAQTLPYEQLDRPCDPKNKGSHDCLEKLPKYSYHLALRSNYGEQLCISLGAWDGQNTIVLEWDGLQTKLNLDGKAGLAQFLEPAQRQGRSSGIVVYSNQPLMPELLSGRCSPAQPATQVTLAAWPESEAGDDLARQNSQAGDSNSVAARP